jgi:hypothetical protein
MEKKLTYRKNGITAEIDICLNGVRLSICGTVFEGEKLRKDERNLIAGGQCLEDCAPIIPLPLLAIWRRWHLNDMRAGTMKQETFLREYRENHPDCRMSYEFACQVLSGADLLEDDGYRYGTAWLKEELPEGVIAYLESL